jgi:hypothetical protein
VRTLLCGLALVLAAGGWAALAPPGSGGPAPASAGVGKGIHDVRLDAATTTAEAEPLVRELRHGLGARWARLIADWRAIEPTRGAYDEEQLARLDRRVAALRAAGVRVVVTTCYLPQWASDERFWTDPPQTYAPGYQPFYPIRADALADYTRLAGMLATRYGRRLAAIECWNEPNLWGFLYPQRTPTDRYFGARTYLGMLKAFTRGVRSSGVRVRVLAGATAPVGQDDKLRTSPQTFARFLKRSGAARWFDGYSHHPYTPGGSRFHSPQRPPNNPRTTVTLYNLRTLLRLFPGKPFYLTEYGYNTQRSVDFAGFSVTEKAQARYLRQAYAMASAHPQVKALFWYLVRDVSSASQPADRGVYTGLRRLDGSKKPSWFAFRNVR